MKSIQSFSCSAYRADWTTGMFEFEYVCLFDTGEEHAFIESLVVPLPQDTSRLHHPSIERMCEMIHMTLGVSYFKMYGPTVIRHPYVFSDAQNAYFELLYTHGLGEYYYTNQLDFRGKVRVVGANGEMPAMDTLPLKQRALILHGGGKDSIVSVEVAKKAGVKFDLFAVGASKIQQMVADVMQKSICTITRQVDQKMVELSKNKEAYNGHVPISAVYTSLAMLYALIHDYAYVVSSNEESAVYGNVEYLGIEVNHQWSKSQVFESQTREFVASRVSEALQFFSLLRPLYEIRIAQLFAQFPQYFEVFSSSNHNFMLNHDGKELRWDVDFSKGKVEFVWVLLSAFVSRDELLRIFQVDIYNRTDRLDVFNQLLGEKKIKPLDCVGTPEETIYAMYMCSQKGEFEDAPIMSYFVNDVLPKHESKLEEYKKIVFGYGDDSHIPPELIQSLKSFLQIV